MCRSQVHDPGNKAVRVVVHRLVTAGVQYVDPHLLQHPGEALAKKLYAEVCELGLEAFEIEPGGEAGTGPKVTVGGELVPGLVARFSRQFGDDPFDEAVVEYYLSRLFRLRATFSDAQAVTARRFRRVERAGIDLLVFFSF